LFLLPNLDLQNNTTAKKSILSFTRLQCIWLRCISVHQ
jgi:hypothetical protein